jgi:hypothetical protein
MALSQLETRTNFAVSAAGVPAGEATTRQPLSGGSEAAKDLRTDSWIHSLESGPACSRKETRST